MRAALWLLIAVGVTSATVARVAHESGDDRSATVAAAAAVVSGTLGLWICYLRRDR